ncbi:outer membrane beta-barrel protein [uncultured Olleya sp.]|uniref:outer membrane beta-barrel protein n=1 Tax=uncultured Olleya sp. TaxID=757243 RepID=UPI002594755D|nr:outer membrane beta-barrel protein [uncultured Olleya sp.]
MKHHLIYFLLVISALSFAQKNNKPSYFGIKVGGNIATISGDFSEEYSSRFSFHIGMTGELEISKTLQLVPEVLFSSVGAENVVLNYITLPIGLRVYPDKNFYLEAGPQVGFSVGAVKEVGSTQFGNDITNVNQTDFGANIGIGVKTDSRVLLGLRYYLGLSNLIQDQTYNNYNRVFQFSIAYLFKN